MVGSAGAIYRYDGTTWNQLIGGFQNDVNSVWTQNPQNVYVAGDQKLIAHYDGTQWEILPTNLAPDADFLSVSGSSSGPNSEYFIFVLGSEGNVVYKHSTEIVWLLRPAGFPVASLAATSLGGRTTAYIAGFHEIRSWNASTQTWVQDTIFWEGINPTRLLGVYAMPDGNAFAVGQESVILHALETP